MDVTQHPPNGREIAMAEMALPGSIEPAKQRGPKLDHAVNPITAILFMGVLAAGILFVAYSIYSDIDATGTKVANYVPFLLLFVALLIALGFEFVNGFHDTANAVATVIYTHSLPANVAVVWSGVWNLLGVLWSSGAVAFGIVSLLPVELILQVGSSAGFAMVFALLIAAIIWNLGTWSFGLPASSSHTLIGSVIGVGIANALLRGRDGTSGVDWNQAIAIGKALLLSPIFGFVPAGILLMAIKFIIRNTELFAEPKGNQPPPWWIRGIHHLYPCELLSRLQRRSERHGPHHADPHRHGAHGLCAQPQHAAKPDRSVRSQLKGGQRSDRRQGGRLQRDRRSAPGGDRLCGATSTQ
jgi:PiT family inorganic phosphate transporter